MKAASGIILCNVCSRDLLLFPSETHSNWRVFRLEVIVLLANQRTRFKEKRNED